MDDTKAFLALLNGLARRNYFGEKELTNEFLKEQVYPDMPDEDYEKLVSRCSNLMRNMVSTDMDMTQLEALLVANMKRREAPLTEEQAAAFRKFWKAQKSKIHDHLVSTTRWGSSLEKMAWRIDLQAQARHQDQINVPSAILELHLTQPGPATDKVAEVVQFEMGEEKLSQILRSMEDIEKSIQHHCEQ